MCVGFGVVGIFVMIRNFKKSCLVKHSIQFIVFSQIVQFSIISKNVSSNCSAQLQAHPPANQASQFYQGLQ